MGTLVSDVLKPVLIGSIVAGVETKHDVDASPANGGVVEVGYPGIVQARLTIGDVTGTNPTADITIEAGNASDLSDAVVVGVFPQKTDAEENSTFLLTIDLTGKRYARAKWTVGGTSPVFPSFLALEEQGYQRVWGAGDTATA